MRGSRPGERRGGRQKGTPNKKTAYVRAVMAAHAAQDNVSPLDLILAVMREPHVALGQRVKMALKALPHVHAKAKAGHPSKLSGAKRDNGSSSPAHVNANARTAAEKVNQELMPLDFLQCVIRDAKTPAALQIKVAQTILPYIRPKRSVRPKRSAIGADHHGFAVDRELACKLRNKVARILQLRRRQNLSPADKKLFVRLSQEIKLMAAALPCPCPSRYSSQNAESDKRRLAWLWRKRARRKLSPVEDGELAHVNARYMAFVSGPEMQGRARLAELKEKERKFLVAFGPPLTYREQALLICLSTLYPQKSEIRDSDIAAQFSVLSMVDVGDDGYSLQHQQAKTPVLAGAGASPASDSAPAEEVDAGEWRTVLGLQIARGSTTPRAPQNSGMSDRTSGRK
jgi:hypothetical protein